MDTSADELLIRRLFHEHGGALVAYAARLMGDPALGADVVQETLIRAGRDPARLIEGRGSVRAYLFTVARAIAVRRARPAGEVPASAPDRADPTVDSLRLLGAMDGLSAEQRDVLRLICFQGRGVEEVAVGLRMPAGAVTSHLYYALRRLREVVTEWPVTVGAAG
jgi:RNA polymerase sigma-70 factor (ECF subfamily)